MEAIIHGVDRATLRIPLPAALVNRVVQCADSGSGVSSGEAWGPLEQVLYGAVYRWVPADARRVRLSWDAAGQEVVVGFELGGRPDGSSGGSARRWRV
ncbi:MAG: hypothetical protein JRH10_06680 [Deltaproteobacteria bacterium]|nr:hypothetical protein [Deltaproteobacteria bacterium]